MLTNVWFVMVNVIKYVQTHLEVIDATVSLGIHTTLIQKDVMVIVLCLYTSIIASTWNVPNIYPGLLLNGNYLE